MTGAGTSLIATVSEVVAGTPTLPAPSVTVTDTGQFPSGSVVSVPAGNARLQVLPVMMASIGVPLTLTNTRVPATSPL